MTVTDRLATFAATAAVALTIAAAPQARADSFRQVTDRSEFLDLVQGRTLKYPGVSLRVTSGGAIQGKGLGIDVTGQWRWQGNYFCRDLYWGERDLGPNCQAVLANGRTLRFVADQGQGRSADFRLR